MPKCSTIILRREAYYRLIANGPMTLSDLSQQVGCPKGKLRYAIESTIPFGAMFRKRVDGETIYEAVSIEDTYGGEDFY